MNKQAPTIGRLLVMVLFALSCFGLLLFLWVSFGGSTPLAPKDYRVSVRIPEATQLAQQSDVRVSGVSIGKVVSLKRDGDRTRAELSIQPQFAPLPASTRVIQRQKTLLGETYLELSTGPRTGPSIPDGQTIPDRNVAGTVELDEVLRSVNARSRRDLQRWIQSWSKALDGRAVDLNDSVGTLATLVDDGGEDLAILARNRRAVQRLVADSSTVFGTVGRRSAQVQELVAASNEIFATTARRRTALRDTVAQLPGFLSALRGTTLPATRLSRELTPAFERLRPAARRLAKELPAAGELADELTTTARALRPVLRAAGTGLPALNGVIRALGPAADRIAPLAAALVPATRFIDAYKSDFTRSWAYVAAATQPTLKSADGRDVHYLRLVLPVTAEVLGIAPNRQPFNRANPYPAPGARASFAAEAPLSFGCDHLKNASLIPPVGTAPQCRTQAPFSIGDEAPRAYPQLRPWRPSSSKSRR